MINKLLLEKIYDSAYVQRWNDKLRPVEFTELDKQAHKMTIAYLLGKFEEGRPGFDWVKIIEVGLFDFLQRLVLTDLKPQLLWEIRKSAPEKYTKLNEWVYDKLGPYILPLGEGFCRRYKDRFSESESDDINTRIVSAAHEYATKWEFDFIEKANPTGYEIYEIKKLILREIEYYSDLEGMKSLALYEKYKNFVEFCGLLRFQYRWGYLYMLPRISVLGHMLIVAILSYLFSLEARACNKRCVNNYFTGLFHDLPEVLTRDIVYPIKRSVPGLDELIKEYEKKEMEAKVYPLIPRKWKKDFKKYTFNEFENVVDSRDNVTNITFGDICTKYNENKYNARDGELVKACDRLAAFLETHLAIKNGISRRTLSEARRDLKEGEDGLDKSILVIQPFDGIGPLLNEFLQEIE
jgi:putative hydrolase of HD superfamily